jgi:hypothetical protein
MLTFKDARTWYRGEGTNLGMIGHDRVPHGGVNDHDGGKLEFVSSGGKLEARKGALGA